MPWVLKISASLDLTDADGNPTGQSFPVNSVAQMISVANPQAADLTAAATAAGASLGAALSALGGTLNTAETND